MTVAAANADTLMHLGAERAWEGISLVARGERESAIEHPVVSDDELAAFDLPPVVYVDNVFDPREGAPRVLAIRRGERGYHPVLTDRSAAELNSARNITEAQVLAMLTGSLLGWDVPGARPWTWAEGAASSDHTRPPTAARPADSPSFPSAMMELQP